MSDLDQYLLKVEEVCVGAHPTERIVEIKTADNQTVEAFCQTCNLVSFAEFAAYKVQLIMVGENNRVLVELPQETAAGDWRIWVNKDQIVSGSAIALKHAPQLPKWHTCLNNSTLEIEKLGKLVLEPTTQGWSIKLNEHWMTIDKISLQEAQQQAIKFAIRVLKETIQQLLPNVEVSDVNAKNQAN